MNPFLYPALIVLCLCGLSTAGAMSIPWGGLIIVPVWITTGRMLAVIALASLTGTGGRGAAITSAVLVAWVAYVLWKIRQPRPAYPPAGSTTVK
jgi:hypothetical protein